MLSLVVRVPRVPLLIVRSALVKPVTAWLKVMVTCEVLPMCCAVLLTTMVATGAGL